MVEFLTMLPCAVVRDFLWDKVTLLAFLWAIDDGAFQNYSPKGDIKIHRNRGYL